MNYKSYNKVRLNITKSGNNYYVDQEQIKLMEAIDFGIVSFKDFDNYEQVALFKNLATVIIASYAYSIDVTATATAGFTINKTTGLLTYVM